MRIISDFDHYNSPAPAVVTIGNFDGVHRGHQALLSILAKRAKQTEGQSVAITFSNHPSEVLRPEKRPELLCSLSQKIQLLEKCQIEVLILFTFTPLFSQQTAAEFVHRLSAHLPLKALILGHDATLGKDRQGNRAEMEKIAIKEHFSLDYISEYTFEGQSVNSTTIREAVKKGFFKQAEQLLGRPYSISGVPLISTSPLIWDLAGLCTPPDGAYQCYSDEHLPLKVTLRDKKLLVESDGTSPQEIIFEKNQIY